MPGKVIGRSIFAVQFLAYTCQQWIHPGEKFLGREATERSVPHPLVAHSANAALDVLCVGDAAERCGNHVAMFESGDELRAFGGIVAKPMEEFGEAPLLHWLRHNSAKRSKFISAFEHCDMVAATLCGITDAKNVKRSICAMGHKWMWNTSLGGLPPQEFLTRVDPLLAGVREKLDGEYATSDHLAGHLSPYWAEQLGLKAGIPIHFGAFDDHWAD